MGIRTMITKSGKRYRVEVMINGRRYSENFKRKRDAEVCLQTLLDLRVQHSGSNQFDEKLFLGKAWTELVYSKRVDEGLDDSTVQAYLKSSRPYLSLFEREVTSITDDEFLGIFKKIRNQRTGKMLSKSYYREYRDHLCQVLRKAVDMGFHRPGIDALFNKMSAFIKNNGTPPKRIPSYTQSEVDALLSTDPIRGAFFTKGVVLILLITGCRIGEILGLTTDKIDFENNTIRIEQMISKQLYHDHLKLGAPFYTIKMDENLRNIILDLMVFNHMRGLGDDPWLFASSQTEKHYRYTQLKNKKGKHKCPYDGKPMTREHIGKKTKEFMEKAGVPIRHLHNLRKTSCTLTYIRYASDPLVNDIIQRKMNHKSVSTTLDFYVDIPDEMLEERMEGHGVSDILDFKKSEVKKAAEKPKDAISVQKVVKKSSELQRLEQKVEELEAKVKIKELEEKLAS